MDEKVERKKKKIEVDVVKLTIELPAEFFDNMDKAKKQVAAQRGYDVTYGEYITEAMNDLVKMVESYSVKLKQADDIIKSQDEAISAALKAEGVEIVQEELPKDPEGQEETDAPADLYAHIEEDSAKEIMYG